MRIKSNRCTTIAIKSYSKVFLKDSEKKNKNKNKEKAILPDGMVKYYLFTLFGERSREIA